MTIKNDDNLSEFGQKLMNLMQESGCDTPKALATKLFEAKLVTVKTRGNNIYKNKDNAIGSVEKKIRNHLHANDANCLQGEFVRAYCTFFQCSADYLFGYTDIRTPSIDVRKMCEMTGLSEKTISRFIQCNDSEHTKHYCIGWSQILDSSLFSGIIKNWLAAGEQALLAAQKDIECKKINNEISNASGPDILDLRCDLEGAETAYKSANAAYAGLLCNISRSMAEFIEYTIAPKINYFQQEFDKYK